MTAEWKIRPRVGVVSPSSPMEVGAERADELAAGVTELLAVSGCDVINAGPIGTAAMAAAVGRQLLEANVDAITFVPACWFEDYLVLDLLEECPVPATFWAIPGMETGSLCGTQQATYFLKQLGAAYQAGYGPIEHGDTLTTLLDFLAAAAVHRQLRRSRVGIAGGNVPGMTEATTHEIAMKKVLGPRIVPIDMVGLLNNGRSQTSSDADDVWARVKSDAGSVRVSDQDGCEAIGMYRAIRQVVHEHALSGLAFGCYPDFMGCACLATSLLADEGIPIGCEGDASAVVAMLTLMALSGEPTHNTDWLDPLPDGSVVFSHCGSGSFRLAEHAADVTLAPVRLVNKRVCALFPSRPGPVTLVSLTPWESGYQMAVLEGEALSTDMVFPGNPLRVRFGRPVQKVMDWIFDEGIGHHWMAAYGHYANSLRHLSRIVGPELHHLTLN